MRLALLVLLVPAVAAADDDVVAKVLAHYEAAAHWTGTFHQELTTVQPREVTKRLGKIWLARGGKVRLDSDKSSIVGDGDHVFLVNHRARYIARKPEVDSPEAAVGLLVASARVKGEFKWHVETASDAVTVRLEPAKPSKWIARVTWLVDAKDFHVREVTVVDGGGNSNHVVIDKLDSKPAVADSWFVIDRKSKQLRTYTFDGLD
jgi:outer membrane lipoprotein-sorting protein